MATRRTTRATKQQGAAITDHFLPNRTSLSSLPGKSLGDEAPATNNRAKRALFSSSVEVTVTEVKEEVLPAPTVVSETKPRTARALFGAPKKAVKVDKEVKEEPKEEVTVPEPVRSMIPTEADVIVPKARTPSKPRSVADLQAELAKKGAAKIHEQATARKLEQIAEREALLKSPTKMVITRITGGSPPKRAKKEKEGKKKAPIKVLPVPDYVLPTSMEKARREREKTEERETSPQEDSLVSAPKGYGSNLMNDEVKKSAHTKLPDSYKEIHDTFKAAEMIVSLFDTANKTLTFDKLSQEVRKQTRKQFTFERLAQIVAVYPEAYHVKAKKVSCVGDRMGGVRSARWEHVIKPNLDDDLIQFVEDPSQLEESAPSEPIFTASPRKNLFSPMKGRPITSSSGIKIPASPRKPSSPAKQAPREAMMDTRKRLKGWRITCRQQVFRCLLARRVISAHEEFMKERNLEIPAPSPFLPLSFHKDFETKINSFCAQIEHAEIEQIPEEENASTSHQGMGEFLKIASDTVTSLPKGVEAALNDLRSPEKKAISSRGVPLSPAKFAQAQKPMSLLERIRAKADAAKAAEMRRDPEMEKKMADLVRLHDDKIICLIFNIYQTNQKKSMEISDMTDRMERSGKITKDKAHSVLNRLCSLVPSHFSLATSSVGQFLKVAENTPSASQEVELALKKELEACRKQVVSNSCTPHGIHGRQ